MILCGLDIETTGLEWASGHRIIEVALILYKDTGEKLGGFVQRINPERSIDPKAQAVHGISFDELVMEPTWNIVAPKVCKVLERCDKVVAHNGKGFDQPFLIHEINRVGLTVPGALYHCIDTMVEGRWATPMGKNPNLGELCFATDTVYEPEKAHSADYDVLVMMEAYFKAKAWGHFADKSGSELTN